MPNRAPPSRHSTSATLALCAALAVGCGHSRADALRPEATLAASSDAQAAFRALRPAWFAGTMNERRKLEPALRTFLVRFPNDEQSDLARVLLAFDCVSRGALTDARVLIAEVREHVGTVNDFAQVAEAYALLRESKADAAWNVLEPLAGKIVDADQRLVFSELRLRVAAAERRYARALSAAEELLSEAPLESQSLLQDTVREVFRTAPKAVLLESLQTFDRAGHDDGATAKARDWLRKMLRERLVTIAVREKDAALARHLLDTAPAALRASDSGSALVGIAGGGQSVPLILGRSVGVALSLGSAEARRRSANLAAGLARGLSLPEAREKPGGVHLISEDDGGSSAGTAEAMRELAAEGAAILVAGVDTESADIAARFAEQTEIAVILLAAPTAPQAPFRHAFVAGESAITQQTAIDAELSRRNLQRVARVGPSGEPCDAPLNDAGRSRFPVDEWHRERVSALLVFGSAACAGEVARELRAASFAPLLALGLEGSEFVYAEDAPQARFALGAGRFPLPARTEAGDNPALPILDWYEALGHDAALLAKAALGGFPDDRVDDSRVVRELHARAERALSTAQAPLWTSGSRGFSEAHVLPRTLTIVSPKTP
ncbi:MAG: hypothetical protein ABJB12_07545 [Pseudomonadota bacterium]